MNQNKLAKPDSLDKEEQKRCEQIEENLKNLPNTTDICSCCNVPIREDEYIYKCLECSDFILCSICLEQKKFSKDHRTGHALIRISDRGEIFGEKYTSTNNINFEMLTRYFQNQIHESFNCKSCLKDSFEPIKGLRFKCDICFDYDLCSKCYEDRKVSKSHTFEHPMIVFGQTESLEIEKSNVELLGDPIGGGAFGVVFRAKLKGSNNIVACKIIKYDLIRFLLFGLNPIELVKSFLRELNAFNQIKVILNYFFI